MWREQRAIHEGSVRAEGLGMWEPPKESHVPPEDEEGARGLSLWEARTLTSSSSMDQPRPYCYLHPCPSSELAAAAVAGQ